MVLRPLQHVQETGNDVRRVGRVLDAFDESRWGDRTQHGCK